MTKYKILVPISHSGRIYTVGDIIELSIDDESYFNFWHRRIQDGEIQIDNASSNVIKHDRPKKTENKTLAAQVDTNENALCNSAEI